MNPIMDPVGILVGDELGQLKKIDLVKKDYQTFNLTPDEPIHPSKSVVSISPLSFGLVNHYFLVATKANSLFIYDALTDEVKNVKYNINNKSSIVCSRCIDDQNIVVGFKNGGLYRINIEKDLCTASYRPNSKALNLLGIENLQSLEEDKNAYKRSKRLNTKPSKVANDSLKDVQNSLTIFEPNWNVDSTYLTCFKVCNDKLAIGGFNSDLKVFDMSTGQHIFIAKSTNTDWLGIKHDIWLSDIDWLSGDNNDPRLIATCSRSEPYIKIYDIRERQKKSILSINLKPVNNANNECNPPSLTTICSLPNSCDSFANLSHSVIVGTTLGRMIAVDIRTKARTSKILGGFKGFSGGSIRDIKCIRDSKTSHKIFSCGLDRFVRIHTLTKTSRLMERKLYIKTRPTCLQPIMSTVFENNQDDGGEEEENDDDEFY